MLATREEREADMLTTGPTTGKGELWRRGMRERGKGNNKWRKSSVYLMWAPLLIHILTAPILPHIQGLLAYGSGGMCWLKGSLCFSNGPIILKYSETSFRMWQVALMRRREFTEMQSTESQNFLFSIQVAEVLNQESMFPGFRFAWRWYLPRSSHGSWRGPKLKKSIHLFCWCQIVTNCARIPKM